MKIQAVLFFTFFNFSVALTDPSIGVTFPDTAGPWAYTGFRIFEPAASGCSYSYKPILGGAGAITCYVYTKGYSRIAIGAESTEVKNEMTEVVAGIFSAWEQEQNAVVEEVVSPKEFRYSENGPVIALYSVHKINLKGIKNISVTIITAYENNLIKLRCTYPGQNVNKVLIDLEKFLRAILDANKESINKYFIPINRQSN